jgi:hypothetical protein
MGSCAWLAVTEHRNARSNGWRFTGYWYQITFLDTTFEFCSTPELRISDIFCEKVKEVASAKRILRGYMHGPGTSVHPGTIEGMEGSFALDARPLPNEEGTI